MQVVGVLLTMHFSQDAGKDTSMSTDARRKMLSGKVVPTGNAAVTANRFVLLGPMDFAILISRRDVVLRTEQVKLDWSNQEREKRRQAGLLAISKLSRLIEQAGKE
jgi:hypothetical protein